MARHDGIIILGHPRSGTTLLRRLLNGHSQIACPGETHLLTACARFLRAEKTADGVDMGVLAGLTFAGFSEAEVIADLRRFAFSYFAKHAERQGKRRWAEKTVFDTFFMPEIEQLCGDQAFFVGIIRHGLDVAVSTNDFCQAAGMFPEALHAYVRRFPSPVEAFAHSWADANQALVDFGERHPENCVICRYEDLVEAPEETLGAVLDFVGETFEAEMLTKGLEVTEDLGFSDHKGLQVREIHTKSTGHWQAIPEPQLRRLADVVNPLLELCGYDRIAKGPALTTEQARRRYTMSLMVHAARGASTDPE